MLLHCGTGVAKFWIVLQFPVKPLGGYVAVSLYGFRGAYVEFRGFLPVRQ